VEDFPKKFYLNEKNLSDYETREVLKIGVRWTDTNKIENENP